jgi:CDP-paratose synthetase
MSPQAILMTGGTGFLGSCLLKRLVQEERPVVLLKRSFSDTSRIKAALPSIVTYDLDKTPLEEVFARHRFQAVLHCATHYGRKEAEPLAVIEANLILPLRLLKLAVDQGTSVFINTDTVLDKRVNNYSLSKAQFFDWMSTYASKLTCINVALEHFYGPGDDSSKFVSYVIREILGQSASLALTPGEQKRDFIYIDDVVEAFLTILRQKFPPAREAFKFEVGTDRNIPIRDFVEQVKRLAGNKATTLRFGDLPYRTNEVMESHVDIRALKELGWTSKVSLEEGLLRTIEFERSGKAKG